ncbi:MAG TPA: hypothetical protein VGJ33_03230 [Candidatus Angelobacter sp.]|jgi:hypothetical protein
MTRQEIIAALLKLTEQLGHTPARVELMRHGGVTRQQIKNNFGTYKQMLEACGLEKVGPGRKAEMADLFRDWTGVVRTLGKIPTHVEYEERSKYSLHPLRTRFGSWLHVPAGLKQYADEQGHAAEWADVRALVDEYARRQKGSWRMAAAQPVPSLILGQPVYGEYIGWDPLICAPTNEQGVVFLFGAMAVSLGFLVLRIQTEFPDCEAFRIVAENRLQRVRIEIEKESRNFMRHMHNPNGCDLIVCWEHNWEECPLPVIELKKELGKLLAAFRTSPLMNTDKTDQENQTSTTEDTKEHRGGKN